MELIDKKEALNAFKDIDPFDFTANLCKIKVENLIPVFDGMTNGQVIQTLFPYVEVVGEDEVFTGVRIDTKGTGTPIALYTEWWNAKYKGGKNV